MARCRRIAPEVAGRVTAGEGIEGDKTRERVARAARLIETDVPGAADAEDLEIDAAGFGNHRLVSGAVRIDFVLVHRAGGQVAACGIKVHPVEEVGAHETPVALRVLRRQRVIFVQVEGRDVGEAQFFLAMQAGQLGVEADRGGAGGEAQHDSALLGLTRADERGDLAGHGAGRLQAARIDRDRDMFMVTTFKNGQGHKREERRIRLGPGMTNSKNGDVFDENANRLQSR